MALLNEGKRKKAVDVLDRCMKIMPKENVPYNVFILGIIEAYYAAHENAKGDKIVQDFARINENDLDFYYSLPPSKAITINSEKQRSMAILQELSRITKKYNQEKLNKEVESKFMHFYQLYSATDGKKG